MTYIAQYVVINAHATDCIACVSLSNSELVQNIILTYFLKPSTLGILKDREMSLIGVLELDTPYVQTHVHVRDHNIDT